MMLGPEVLLRVSDTCPKRRQCLSPRSPKGFGQQDSSTTTIVALVDEPLAWNPVSGILTREIFPCLSLNPMGSTWKGERKSPKISEGKGHMGKISVDLIGRGCRFGLSLFSVANTCCLHVWLLMSVCAYCNVFTSCLGDSSPNNSYGSLYSLLSE